ncbi:MAG TPA: amidase [Acidimicrobiales bacterium]|nr:amidase [Acidimicrobiales bacterium]
MTSIPLNEELEEITIAQLQAGLRAGTLTAGDLVTGYLERIDRWDKKGPALNTIVEVSATVLREAHELDREFGKTRTFRGPLHGVPVIIKDQLETAGLRTTFGSVRAKDNVPDRDATAVALLKGAGALILAKSTLPDFATSWFSTSSLSGLTKNPYALDRDAGGSSSGSAAAVAANMGLAAIGEDTGGSIRLPASFNNVVGLRPTVGLVSTAGASSFRIGTDTVGPIARTVEDVARLLDVLARVDSRDPLTALAEGHRRSRGTSYLDAARLDGGAITGRPVKLALVTSLTPGSGPDGVAINDVVEKAVAMLLSAAVDVVPIDLPDILDRVRLSNAGSSMDDIDAFIKSRPGIAADSIGEIYDAGDYHERLTILRRAVELSRLPSTADEQLSADRTRRSLREYVAAIICDGEFDALAYPDVQALPPRHDEIVSGRVDSVEFPTNTVLASALRFPAISVPAGFTGSNLPVGLELLGLPFSEGPLLRVAAQIEAILRGRRKPSL